MFRLHNNIIPSCISSVFNSFIASHTDVALPALECFSSIEPICDLILENHPFGHDGQFSVL